MADDTLCYKNSSDPPANSSDNTTGKNGADANADEPADAVSPDNSAKEIGGRNGPDPTRYGDWEKNGRCIDF